MVIRWGKRSKLCDGTTRRDFLQAGALSLAGLSLADVLRGRAAAAPTAATRKTSVIYIELAGGPSHFETYDPKPLAPSEYRGPLGVAATNVPGVNFSELMAEQAKVADRLTVLRGIHHPSNSHDPSSHLVQTGYYKRNTSAGVNEMPCFAAVAARVKGANASGVPAYVAIPRVMRNGATGYLGKAYLPFETVESPERTNYQVRNLALAGGLDVPRIENRRALMAKFDAARRMADLDGAAAAMDDFSRQAFDMVTGSRAVEAFDIAREPESAREAYGMTGAGQGLLLARRLVEAGVTCVTVRVGGWDDHTKIAERMQTKGPAYDRAVAALVRDLADRGLMEDVLVVAMGEFGRTPRVNRNAGRDHWGAVMSVLLAGGGLRPGVLGASNPKGEVPVEAPYRPENVLAMVYRHLGIDPQTTFDDLAGRPRYVLEERGLIEELL